VTTSLTIKAVVGIELSRQSVSRPKALRHRPQRFMDIAAKFGVDFCWLGQRGKIEEASIAQSSTIRDDSMSHANRAPVPVIEPKVIASPDSPGTGP